MNYAQGKTAAAYRASNQSGFYSPAHGLYFFDGETPPPLDAAPVPIPASVPILDVKPTELPTNTALDKGDISVIEGNADEGVAKSNPRGKK